ncbi:MAG: hypothetical protein FJ191_13705 [Gammaproteobacteria bacterium]|nr:hypothetical protein [Gammaproteobacteria bacterium]
MVAELSAELAGAGEPGDTTRDYQRNRLARVLTGWFESPEYTDSQGLPRPLPLTGPAPSFHELVRAFSGDLYPRIILDELLRVGAVQLLPDGTVRAVSRRYTVGGADTEALRHLGTVAHDLLSTLEHNLTAPAGARLFEDSIVSVRFDARALPLLHHLLQRRGASLLHDVEGWLAEHELGGDGDTVRAGVMIQMLIDRDAGPGD